MSAIERYQNPTENSNVILRLFTYNSNNPASVQSINSVSIYFHDDTLKCPENPLGLRLITTLGGADVVSDCPGNYNTTVFIDPTCFAIGHYTDRWNVTFESDEPPANIDNWFQIYPRLWYTTPLPIVYSFSFTFRENRLRKGSKQWLIAEVTPNVPTASDLARYYENIAINGGLKIYIEYFCGICVPQEEDLRMVVDGEHVQFRERLHGYYHLDTEKLDMECGMYNVWFKLEFGDNCYLSDKMQLQLFS